jgi:hypothetical protein
LIVFWFIDRIRVTKPSNTFQIVPKTLTQKRPIFQTLTQKPKTINKTSFIDRFDRFIDRFEVLLIVLSFWVRVCNFGCFG